MIMAVCKLANHIDHLRNVHVIVDIGEDGGLDEIALVSYALATCTDKYSNCSYSDGPVGF